MLILGIETSCDETSVALVEDGRRILANVVASQVQLHARFGGVVPEIASRAHIQRLMPMIEEILSSRGLDLDDVDALAVTLGPGLVGALLIGVETAKTLAFARRKPLIPVHHIAGHLYSPFLYGEESAYQLIVLEPDGEGKLSAVGEAARQGSTGETLGQGAQGDRSGSAAEAAGASDLPLGFPYIGLVVSGGHTSLVRVHSPSSYEPLGETVDDAAGEAFDKVAKLLELGYPGGPLVERYSRGGNPAAFALPRPMLHSGDFGFSFSGLKTAVLKLINDLGGAECIRQDERLLADLCASFQEAVVEVLLRKAGAALEKTGRKELAVVGGVACNGRLRAAVPDYLPGVRAVFPPPALCTDNAAMIAGLAWHLRDRHRGCDLTLNASAELSLSRGWWG